MLADERHKYLSRIYEWFINITVLYLAIYVIVSYKFFQIGKVKIRFELI